MTVDIAGVTVMLTSVAGVTVTVLVPVWPPGAVAVIVDIPRASVWARPAGVIETTVGAEVDHVTWFVMSARVPSE